MAAALQILVALLRAIPALEGLLRSALAARDGERARQAAMRQAAKDAAVDAAVDSRDSIVIHRV